MKKNSQCFAVGFNDFMFFIKDTAVYNDNGPCLFHSLFRVVRLKSVFKVKVKMFDCGYLNDVTPEK